MKFRWGYGSSVQCDFRSPLELYMERVVPLRSFKVDP